MKALQEYKKFVDEVQHLFWVFTDIEPKDSIQASALKTWTIDDVKGYATGALRYRPDERIKEELTGDALTKQHYKGFEAHPLYRMFDLTNKVIGAIDDGTVSIVNGEISIDKSCKWR